MDGRYILVGSNLEKCGKLWKNGRFSAGMAGLGKYCMGGYGRIGVYRVKASSRCHCPEMPARLLEQAN